MTKLLNFNPDRALGFDVDRDLRFSPDRPLLFDSDRDLSFDVNRDLGFGKRGVIFRGYICSNCKALVDPTAVECNECGAVFETKEKKTPAKSKEAEPEEGRFCVYCGYPSSGSDVYCRNCGLKISRAPSQMSKSRTERTPRGKYESVKLPKERGKKVLTDWSETGKDFQEFVEE